MILLKTPKCLPLSSHNVQVEKSTLLFTYCCGSLGDADKIIKVTYLMQMGIALPKGRAYSLSRLLLPEAQSGRNTLARLLSHTWLSPAARSSREKDARTLQNKLQLDGKGDHQVGLEQGPCGALQHNSPCPGTAGGDDSGHHPPSLLGV